MNPFPRLSAGITALVGDDVDEARSCELMMTRILVDYRMRTCREATDSRRLLIIAMPAHCRCPQQRDTPQLSINQSAKNRDR
jgi:hypothetical protein